MLGSGAMTNSIEDITQNAEVILLVGSNPEEAHPVVGMQIRAAVERGARLIVADPRTIGLATQADIHLKLKPGTNVAFANGMVHVLLRNGLVDKSFMANRTEGLEILRATVAKYTPDYVEEVCGIDRRDLESAAKMYGRASAAALVYCLGVTEHTTGTDGVMALSNIAMVTGNLGRHGGGVNPLRGQNNVQGACDMGVGPDDFPGYQKVANAQVMEKFETAWGVELPKERGIKATECFPLMVEGSIKALFLAGEDPVRTDPDTAHVIKALESLEFFVACDLFITETAAYADVVLPVCSYAEKEGTFTNTERRVQRVRTAVQVEGDMLPDTEIWARLMSLMEYDQPVLSPAQIMDEVARLTPSYGGISHVRLDGEKVAGQGLQWPCLDEEHPGTPMLHKGEFTKGIGSFATPSYQASTEVPDADYPLILTTGRVLCQYNAQAMTARTQGLNEIEGSSFIELHSCDARELSIDDGEMVRIVSRRGCVEARARVSDKTNPGQTWMPFHFQDANSNWLTIAALDRVSKTPEYKVCAVRVEKIRLMD